MSTQKMCQRYLDKETGEEVMKIIGSPLYEKHKRKLSGHALTTKDCLFSLVNKEGDLLVPSGTEIVFVLKQLTIDDKKENFLTVSGEYDKKRFSMSLKVSTGSFIKAVEWLQKFQHN